MKAIVRVSLRAGILDPQGKAVADTLARMGYEEVVTARVGKVIELDLEGVSDPTVAHTRVREMCQALLANTVIETFDIEIL